MTAAARGNARLSGGTVLLGRGGELNRFLLQQRHYPISYIRRIFRGIPQYVADQMIGIPRLLQIMVASQGIDRPAGFGMFQLAIQ
ncbi:MAG: hypothetical protein M5R42_11960 [Rhodocyclaceae bacterium]|nr:hypothetical protein [Rhodocyclaceae bacterium]